MREQSFRLAQIANGEETPVDPDPRIYVRNPLPQTFREPEWATEEIGLGVSRCPLTSQDF